MYPLQILSLLAAASGARILSVYTIPCLSHQLVHRVLTQDLATRDHDLVVITTDPHLPKYRPANRVREIDIHNVSYGTWSRAMSQVSISRKSTVEIFHNIILKNLKELFDAQLETTEIKDLIQNKSESFDLVIVGCLFRPVFFYGKPFKAPVIGFTSSMGMQFNFDSTGFPSHPILYPDGMQNKFGDFNFFDRLNVIYTDLWVRYAYWSSVQEENRIGRKHFGHDTPDIQELLYGIDMMFLNCNPVWSGVKPFPPAVVCVDRLQINPANELAKELKGYLDGCTKGVVYMSLGTSIKSANLPTDRLQIFQRVFRELDNCVLWKWEADEMPGKPDNVRLARWLPQADLLHHPHIRVFITQCGLQSTEEAIEAGVPLIGVPFMSDQERNAKKYELHGIGIAVDLKTLNTKVLKDAVLRVAEDERVRTENSSLETGE